MVMSVELSVKRFAGKTESTRVKPVTVPLVHYKSHMN
jgi:hypothetical protein